MLAATPHAVQPQVGPTAGGYAIETWSERRQEEMMRECKAALDAKATNRFNQYYKPPTKAQQFVASGIPFAVNFESYSAEYSRAWLQRGISRRRFQTGGSPRQ